MSIFQYKYRYDNKHRLILWLKYLFVVYTNYLSWNSNLTYPLYIYTDILNDVVQSANKTKLGKLPVFFYIVLIKNLSRTCIKIKI